MADKILNKLYIEVWRQNNAKAKGKFETYTIENVSTGTSFLEMLDILNNELIEKGIDPIAFDHDCREGICGTCSLYINGRPHGPDSAVTTCQLHMRKFKEGETITIEPWRAKAFPVIKDLVVNRSAFEKILQAGGFVSVNTGGIPDGNAILISHEDAEESIKQRARNMVAKMDELGFGGCTNTQACEAECPKSISIYNIARLNREYLSARFSE